MASANVASSYDAEQAAKFKAANADYPLRWHPRGGWAKKIAGKVYYFGKVTPEDALAEYLHDKAWREGGEVPPAYDPAATTLLQACNEFLADKKAKVASGEMQQRTWAEYHAVCEAMLAHFGKSRIVANLRPLDFTALRAKLAAKCGPVRLKNEITRVRSVFKFAFKHDLVSVPVKAVEAMATPSRSTIRKLRNAKGRQDFTPAELKRIIAKAKGQLRAMILLGVNAALENGSIAELTIERIDLKNGWLDWPRPKTGALRRAKLWPETVKAIKAVVGKRQSGLVFQTRFLNAWTPTAIIHEFRDVLTALKLTKQGRAFYGLRRSFSTIANETGDAAAIDLVMGHISDESMHDLYVQHVADERLVRVAEHVRKAIFGKRGAK